MKPMLAYNYENQDVRGWWVSEKYDGVRGIWDGRNLLSRQNNVYTVPKFIESQLSQIKNHILDGEIWFGRDTFDVASGAARKNENNDEIWKDMYFMVFDLIINDVVFEKRQEILHNLFKNLITPNIRLVKHHKLEKSVEDELKNIEDKKGEGIMLRRPYSLYSNKRSKDLLKVKSFFTDECKVIGYEEGTGRLKGQVGSLEVEKDGKIFKVGSGLSDYERGCDPKLWKKSIKDVDNYRKTLNNVPIIGSIITFKYKEITKKSEVPKFPTFVSIRNYE